MHIIWLAKLPDHSKHSIHVSQWASWEKEMAAHSSVLAWRIPRSEEPGGLLSMESHRVGHDWNDLAAAAALGFPGGTGGKKPPCQCRRHKRCGFDPCPGRSPGGGHGNPLQYSSLENPMDRGAWQATVHRAAESQTQLKWLGTHVYIHMSAIIIVFITLICNISSFTGHVIGSVTTPTTLEFFISYTPPGWFHVLSSL